MLFDQGLRRLDVGGMVTCAKEVLRPRTPDILARECAAVVYVAASSLDLIGRIERCAKVKPKPS